MNEMVMVMDLTKTPSVFGPDFGPMPRSEAQEMIDRAVGTLREGSYAIVSLDRSQSLG